MDKLGRSRADMFISYAREDRKFVQRLHDALANEGRESWVDWEGIPASAKWMAEVRAAIDEADCFCFVVSPDSVESQVCREEAAHAAASNKRIIPLLHREVPDGLVPESVAAHNWISFDDGASFDEAFAILVRALETEPEHLRAHTRLLVRSKEWQGSDRDRSHLLRGSDLSQAEDWLASSASKEPAPTQGQTAYVLASRKAASRRQRTVVAAVAVALVISLVLSGVAIVQRSEAIDAQFRAEEQTRIANSRAIAAQALLNMDTRLDVGILLALEAYDTAPSPEALEVLHIAGQRSLGIDRTIRAHEGTVDAIAYSPDGELIASGGDDGLVVLADPSTGLPVGDPIDVDPTGVRDLAFDPNGDVLATAGIGGASLWEIDSGKRLLGPLSTGAGEGLSVALSPGGSLIAFGQNQGNVGVWSAETGDLIMAIPPGDEGEADGLAFSPDGKSLAVGYRQKGVARIYDPLNGREVDTLKTGSALLSDLAFSPDGSTIAIGTLDRSSAADGDILMWDVGDADRPARLEGHTDTVTNVVFSPSGRLIASASVDGTVRIWDLRSRDEVGQRLKAHAGPVRSVAFSPDGLYLVSGGSEGEVVVSDMRQRVPSEGGAVNIVAFSPDGTLLASAEPYAFSAQGVIVGSGTVAVRDAETMRTIEVLPLERTRPYGLAFTPDGTALVVSTLDDGDVFRWNLINDEITLDFEVALEGSAYINPLALSPDGEIIAAAEGGAGALYVWEGSSDVPSQQLDPGSPVYPIVFSPDGREMASGSYLGSVSIWDTDRWELSGETIATGLVQLGALAYRPDGSMLAAGGHGGWVEVLDAETHEELAQLEVGEGVGSLAFSPDGDILAVGTESGAVAMFDVMTWRQIGEPIQGQQDWVNSLAFSPDGDLLAAGSEDGSIMVLDPLAWTSDLQLIQSRLCAIAGRDLTSGERTTYLPAAEDGTTCPGTPSARLGA